MGYRTPDSLHFCRDETYRRQCLRNSLMIPVVPLIRYPLSYTKRGEMIGFVFGQSPLGALGTLPRMAKQHDLRAEFA